MNATPSTRRLLSLSRLLRAGTGGYEKFLGIVLFGQPTFNRVLQNYDYREIAERLDVVHMPKLGKQAWDYVTHRISLAGGDADKLFERAAVTRLAEQASTPLAIGNLVNAALIQTHRVGERKVLASYIKKSSDEPAVLSVRRAS